MSVTPRFADDDGFPPDASKSPPAKPESARPTPSPLDWHDLANKEPPERRWAVRGWFGFGHVTLLVGQGGIGKTLIAQQMASCLALGKPFIGDVDGPLRCLMWACEDDHDELWRRQVKIAKWADAGLDAFAENLVIVPRHGLENTIVSSEFGKLLYSPLLEDLREQVNDLHAEVVILDNVGQLYGGGENDRHAVTAFLNALSGALGPRALMLLAHPSRSAGSEFSGSSAWENVARTRLYLGANLPDAKPSEETEPADNVRYLARRKANYSPKDWHKLIYAEGALTPEEAPVGAGGMIGYLRDEATDRVTLDGLRRLQEMSIDSTESSNSPSFLPRLLLEYKLADGRNRAELASAMRRLISANRIQKAVIGKYSNRSPKYGLRCAG